MDWQDFSDRFNELNEIAARHTATIDGKEREKNLLMPFFCFHVPYTILFRIGKMDETFGIGGGEDVDYRIRALLAGFDVVYAPKSYLLHFMGKSTWRGGETATETAKRNAAYRNRFAEKWGLSLTSIFLSGANVGPAAKRLGVEDALKRGKFLEVVQACLKADRDSVAGKVRPRICLSMIVKDEAPVIRRCLESVQRMVDYWVIVDTGSTDDTQKIIHDCMFSMPGELCERRWVDFAHNRNEALDLARNKADYSLIMDADDTLEFVSDFSLQDLTADSYLLSIADASTVYQRIQLVSNALPWRYDGVLHEFLTCDSAKTQEALQGVVMRRNHDGARRRDPQTYRCDAEILERALETESRDSLKARYTFYLAQSYRDAGDKEKALRHYLKRAELGFWDQEIFISLYRAAQMKEQLGYADTDVIGSYLKAYGACPSRAESLHDAVRYCRNKSKHHEGYLIGKHGVTIPQPASGLFVQPWIYDYGMLDEFSVVAYWSGHYQECLDASLRLLREGKIPEHYRPRIESNAAFARKNLPAVVTDRPAAPEFDARVTPGDAQEAGGRPRVTVVAVSPEEQPHSAALQDMADTVVHGFRQLGCDVRKTSAPLDETGQMVVIGAHLLSPDQARRLPPGTIIYNTEHSTRIAAGAAGHDYSTLLKQHTVWDYSQDNTRRLSALIGKDVRFVPIGYAPAMTRIEDNPHQDIDVLFYGSVNPRRQSILDQLKAMGLHTHFVFGVYGRERDSLVARSKVVLNLHFYEPGAFEIVRISYLLANRKAVVTECNAGEAVDADLPGALVAVAYNELAEACRSLVADDERRRKLELSGFLAFSARDEAAILEGVPSDHSSRTPSGRRLPFGR